MTKKGFSLIELMVVFAIIGILASLALVSYQGAKKSSRDGRRKADLEQIRSALEMYRADSGNYPAETGCDSSRGTAGSDCTCPAAGPGGSDWGGNIASALETRYIQDLPRDPINDATYFYYYEPVCNQTSSICGISKTCTGTGNCCAYELGVRLETTGQCYRVCNP